jgi:uncharacterized protein YraI
MNPLVAGGKGAAVRSRLVSVWLCAMIAFGAVSGALVIPPASVFAAFATVSQEAPLYDSADPAAPVIALLPEGTTVSIDGPPVDGFYPVTAGDLSGWMRGETVQVEKDLAESDAAEMVVDASLDETNEGVPAPEAVSADGMTPENEFILVDVVAPAPDLASTVDVTPAPATPDGAVPLPDSGAPAAEGAVQPTIDANVTPLPLSEAAAVGPASVMVDAPILAGPGPEYGFIATAPAGSTVEQTGHVINGYATVQYAEVTGWLALAHLGTAGAHVEETTSEETAALVETLPADAPPVETSPTKTASSETSLAEPAPIEAAASETAPVEAAPVAAP